MAFIFGFVLSVSGVVGLVLGSGLSYKLRPRFPWVDPVICGLGLVVSAPFLFVAIGMAADSIVQAFVLVAIGETFLNMNWAIVVDLAMVRGRLHISESKFIVESTFSLK